MKKAFKTEDVFTVVTGIMLSQPSNYHQLMDHLYPGIMTIGTAAMQPHASAAIKSQHPRMAEFLRTACDPKDYEEFNQLSRVCFGSEMEIDGPLEVEDGVISAAFDKFGKRKK